MLAYREKLKKQIELEIDIEYILSINNNKEWTELKLNIHYWENNAFEDAIIEGNIDKLIWLKKNDCPEKLKSIYEEEYDFTLENPSIYYTAIKYKHLHILKWAYENNYPYVKNLITYATIIGDLKIIKWLKKKGFKFSESTFSYAILNEDLKIIKWLNDNNCCFNIKTYKIALRVGNTEIITWLEKNVSNYQELTEEFNISKKIKELKEFKKNCKYWDWNYKVFSDACIEGDINKMKWLKENGCPFCHYTFNSAALNGNLENMKWLKENGCPFGNAFQGAALNGNLENMNWLKENGFPFGNAFQGAAENGNLENMKWLKENGCPFSDYTFGLAAKYGNLDNMIWLKDNGCNFDKYTFQNAIIHGNLKNLIWLKNNNCDYEPPNFKITVEEKVCRWLDINGYPLINIYDFQVKK